VAAGDTAGLFFYWSGSTGAPGSFQGSSDVISLAFAADNRLLSRHSDGVIRRWGLERASIQAAGPPALVTTLPFAIDSVSGRVAGLNDSAHRNQLTLFQSDGSSGAGPIDATDEVKSIMLRGDRMIVWAGEKMVQIYDTSAVGIPLERTITTAKP